jgi:hypothetical protein
MQLWMGGLVPLPSAGPMTSIQAKFAVFYGKVAERPSGWYWTAAPDDLDEPPKGPITGPFETKADAMEMRSGGCPQPHPGARPPRKPTKP